MEEKVIENLLLQISFQRSRLGEKAKTISHLGIGGAIFSSVFDMCLVINFLEVVIFIISFINWQGCIYINL